MVGDRGMITSARIDALNQQQDGTPQPDTYGWITALRAPAIRKLMADDGPLQLSLFDEQDLAEITSPDFPGERLIACRNPVLAADRARTREDLLAATEKLLAPLLARVQAGRLQGAGRDRGRGRQGDHQVQDRQALRRHHHRYHPDHRPDSRTGSTPKPPWTGSTCCAPPSPPASSTQPAWSPPTRTSNTWNGTSGTSNPTTWTCGPVFHRLEERVKAHVLICMLACYLTWHLRRAWAPLTFTDQDPPEQDNPVGPARRSAAAQAKASGPARPGRAALPQLPRPARAPGHPDPQPGPVHRHPGHHRDAHRADQHPAARLPAHRRSDPADLEVARMPPGRSSKTPGQTRNRPQN